MTLKISKKFHPAKITFFFRNFYTSIKYTSSINMFAITRFLCLRFVTSVPNSGIRRMPGQFLLTSCDLVGQTGFGTGFADKPILGWDKPVWGITRYRVRLMFKVMGCRACRHIKNDYYKDNNVGGQK